jgi:serine/threonine protein kinase
METTTSILGTGDVLGGFRVDELIGMGATAIVYRAEQLSLGRPVALKVLMLQQADDDAFRTRFRHEGKHLAALEHPNIVPVYDCGESDGLLYIAMRLVDGTNLAQMIRRDGLSAEETVHLLRPIASALDAAHAEALIHRDVKPQNILVTSRGHPYLADFGVAKGSNTFGLTATGGFVGSVNYASPEQIDGSTLTNASDIYALTAVLYHCLTGSVPYIRRSDAAIMQAHLHDPPPTLPNDNGDAGDLNLAIARGMAKNPAMRYQSARELLSTAAHAVARLSVRRRIATPAFSLAKQVTASQSQLPGRAGSSHLSVDTHASDPTVSDRWRRADGVPTIAPSQRGRRWPFTAAVLGSVVIAVVAFGLVAQSKGGMPKRIVSREILDLNPILNPIKAARIDLVGRKPRNALGLADVEQQLAARDVDAAARLSQLQIQTSVRRAGIATLAGALRAESASLRALAIAARGGDDSSYGRTLSMISTTQGSVSSAIRRAAALGFSVAMLPAIPVRALTLPKAKRRISRPKPSSSRAKAVPAAPAVSSSSSVPAVEQTHALEAVHESPAPTVSHKAAQHGSSNQSYGPRVVAPPAGG